MGLFDAVAQLGKIAIRTAVLPVAVVKDFVDVAGGGNAPSSTGEQLEKLGNEILELPDKVTEKK